MKVIFLDHFGVVCLAAKHGRVSNWDELPRFEEMRVHGDFDPFDVGAISVLNEVLEESNAEIIVSSDWKCWASLDSMQEFYLTQGVSKPPMGFTPPIKNVVDISSFQFEENYHIQQQRCIEVSAWLSEHPEVTHWVCVDDLYLGARVNDTCRHWGLENFVWVSRTDQGLKQDNVKEKILSYLTSVPTLNRKNSIGY